MNTETENLRDRLYEAVQAHGHRRAQIHRGVLPSMVAIVTLQHEQASAQIELMNEEEFPSYIYISDIRAEKRRQGQGRALLMKIFDLADALAVDRVELVAINDGIYFHAANYAHADPLRWERLQQELIWNLESLSRQHEITPDFKHREDQARAAIEQSNGNLGEIIAKTKHPLSGPEAAKYPTLARYLFSPEALRSYEAYWSPAERAQARAACGWVTPEPVARPASALLQPRQPRSGLGQRIKNYFFG